jgi:predicted PurR-regulated permease PerM
MVFWIGILVGGTFAWFAIKLGFYQTWTLVFNVIISIYLAVYLRPIVANISAVGNTSYSNALAMVVIALASFLILHGISYTFLTGQFNVSFPTVFDTLGAGLLGFLAGFLVWSFLSLLIYITPVSQNTFVREIGFKDEYQHTSVSYVSRICNLVNVVVSSQENRNTTEETIGKLIERAKTKKTVEESEPVEPATPKDAETSVKEEEELGPPPEIDMEGI